VLGCVVRSYALHRRDHDLASAFLGFLAGGVLDGLGELYGVAIGFVTDCLQQLSLCLGRRHAAHALESRHMVLVGAGQFLSGGFEFALSVQKLAVALLEHVGAHVQLFVTGQEAAFKAAEFGALGAGFVFGLALQAQLLVFGGKDQFLLLGACLGNDAGGLLLRALDCLTGNQAAGYEAYDRARNKGSHDNGGHKGDFHIQFPPTRSN
jgi:hypothetical protein